MARKPGLKGVYRLLDANLNRCREGLRVLEDTARFVWDDESLFRAFRGARHGLDRITRERYPALVRARDSQSDRGRKMEEGSRSGIRDVVAANLRRCAESLRVLEEYDKIFPRGASAEFKRIRFRIYALEKRILNAL
jgi:thiamine-phosphate pyrophosphorylase